jgi:uncharacterized protein
MPAHEDAQSGLALLKNAIVEFVREHPNGVTNAEIATGLGIESDYEGEHPSYLSWSIIGLLLAERRLRYERQGRSKVYFVQGG